jgi:hypothetical protein
MIITIFLIIFFLIIASISKSIMDTVNFHFEKSIFSKFKNNLWWDQKQSWKNKYKNKDPLQGSAFFGSTTFLVFLTDAWHFFQMLMLISLFIIPILSLSLCITLSWYWLIIIFFIIKIIFSIIFELFWSKIWIKN